MKKIAALAILMLCFLTGCAAPRRQEIMSEPEAEVPKSEMQSNEA